MKLKLSSAVFCLLSFSSIFFFLSCKKESASFVQVSFSSNAPERIASESGEYVLDGHISSQTPLDKVPLPRQGQTTPFLTDQSQAKNKKEYDYAYRINGITSNTIIIMDVYDQRGGRSGVQFTIKKK